MARPRGFDEKQVLNAVRDQFWDAGYAATSLEDLMRVSGLGKGSIYAAFGDKRHLFLRALHRYADDIVDQLRHSLAATPRAVDALHALVESPIEDTARRGCLLANSTTELDGADPDVRVIAHRTYEASTALIAECVARAQREGDQPVEADPNALARALLAAQQGILFMNRTGLDAAALRSTARLLADRLLLDRSGD